MYCPKCGNELKDNAKFCGKCGYNIVNYKGLQEQENIEQVLDEDELILINFSRCLGFGLLVILVIIVCWTNIQPFKNNKILYKYYENNEVIFIDKKGREQFKLPIDKSKVVGECREDRVFVGKKIKEVQNEEYGYYYFYYILEFSILDNKGKLIKKFDKKAVSITEDGETTASYMPEFYKGYAVIHCVDEKDINKKYIDYKDLHITDVYIDKNGNIVENVPNEIKEKLKDETLTYSRFEEDKDITFKRMRCDANDEIGDCLGYVDKKGKTKIEPRFDAVYLESGNWYGRNPRFYDGIAAVYLRDGYIDQGNYAVLSGNYVFINKQGKPINNQTYSYAEPFYGDLAYVSTDEKSGYINRQGKWVFPKENKKLKRDLKKVYNSSVKYCITQPLAARREINDCIEENIRKESEELYQEYINIYNNCFSNDDLSMADKDNCVHQKCNSY